MRRVLATLAALLLVVGGAAPALATGPTTHDSDGTTGLGATEADQASMSATGAAVTQEAPPDPDADRIGWEAGYWYNESIDVDQSDGVSDAELEAVVARTMARVEVVRDLEFKETVPVEIISREEYRNQSANRTYNDSFRTFDDTKFEAMFLVGEDEDALEVQAEGSGSSVLGYYSPSEDAIVLIANNASSMKLDEYTLAHELVHALQDQHFDLTSFESTTRDGANANSGIIEGDANFVQYKYRKRCEDPEDAWNGTCVLPPASESGGGGAPPNMGVYFLKFQPYSDGPKFVSSVYSQGGWSAVNDVYANPPTTAEQVIHPEKYGSDDPANVRFRDQLGDGWERVKPPNRANYAEVGQTGIASMLVYPLYHSSGSTRIVSPTTWLNYTSGNQISPFDPLNYGFSAAEGWDGDRMHFYQNGDGEVGYVWRIAWDSQDDAAEFRGAYAQVLRYWGAQQVGENVYRIPEEADGGFADAFYVGVEGKTVTIVNAPTVEQLSEVRTSIDVQTTTGTPSDDGSTTGTDDGGSETTDTGDENGGTTTVTDTETPGFAVVTAVLAFLLATLVVGRRLD
jgi:hypothetical protein